MSMYKNIFVTEEVNASGEQTISINGEINLYGEGAYASLDEAVAAVAAVEQNAVIRVQSGKYDSFYVATEGVLSTPNKVIAVDFDGGEAMIGGEVITVADSGIEAEQQASILADLNDASAAEGRIFVAVENAPADATTLYVGMGDYGYVAGAAAAVVTGNNMGEIADVFTESVITKPVEATAVSNGIYVSNEYNSSTAGWGTTHFNNYSGAYAYATANNTKATIVIEKTNTLSGNTFDNNHKNFTNLAVIVKDGASIGDSLSKWDMTYKVTVEAGGKITAARPINSSTSNIHIKNALVLQGEPGKAAVFDLLSDSYADGDISLRYNGSITASNAKIRVQDLDCQGKITLTDTEVTVDGAFATATSIIYKSTFTNCEITVGGTQISGGLSDFSGGDANQLGNTTLNNTKLTFNSGVVKVKYDVKVNGTSELNVVALDIASGKKITMDSTSKLSLETLTGAGKIEITLLDGFVQGSKLIDFKNDDATEDMLSKITVKGKEGFAMIQEGDIYVYAGKAQADFDFNQNEKNTLEGEVVAKTVTLDNSKELAVTGEINAFDSAEITNAAVEGEAQGVLNGGYDADGKELAAKITAGNNIVIQNDGHANVELDAKKIVIANNSVNTLIGNIGTAETENVVIAAGTATADGVTVTGNGTVDGAIKDATITAGQIEISGQVVADTELNGKVAITGNSQFNDGVVSSDITKVVNDATLTIAEGATFNTNKLAVGADNYGSLSVGDVTGADKGGNVIVNGTVQAASGALNINVDANGTMTVANDGKVVASQIAVENGGLTLDENTVAGQLTVADGGSLEARYLKAFGGGTINVDGSVELNHSDPRQNLLQVWDNGTVNINSTGSIDITKHNASVGENGTLNINGGALNITLNDSSTGNGGVLTNSGTVVLNGGSITAERGMTNDGKIVVSDDSTLNAAVTGNGFVQVVEGDIVINNTFNNKQLIVGEAGGVNLFPAADAQADASTSTGATVTIKADTKVNAAWVGKAHGTAEAVEDNSKAFNLIVDGAEFNTAYTKVVNTGYFKATNGAVVSSAEFLLRNDALIEKNSSMTIAKGQAYGESGMTSTMTVKDSKLEFTHADNKVSGAAFSIGHGSDATRKGALVLDNAEVDVNGTLTVNATGKVSANNVDLYAYSVTNNGYISVSGESTLNIGSLAGSGDVDLLDGAIIKDSTVGGDASVVGKVTFAGDNTFNNLYDFGTYYASYYNGANAEIVVEEGASLTLTHKVGNAYGLGYGDKLTVNGSLVDAREVDRSTLTAEDASFYAEKGIRLSTSKGNDAADGSFFTVNNAYVVVGNSGSFSNSKTAGKFTIDVNNSVFDASQIYFSESSDVIDMSFDNSDIKTSIFMTEDKDSVYALKDSTLIATGTGTDRYNGNGGSLTVTNSDITIVQGAYTNNGTIVLTDSTLSAGSIVNNGTINLTVTDAKLAGIMGNTYTVINQTGNGAALDLKVSYNGSAYGIGESFTVNGIEYSVVNGDGNDIAIEAAASILTVDPSYTSETEGYGFNKFSSFTAALQKAAESDVVTKINVAGDIAEEIMPTDIEFIVSNNIVIDAEEEVTVNLKNAGTSYDIVLNSTNGSKITFGKNVTVKLDDRIIWAGYYGNNVDIEIKGTVSSYQWWNGADTTVEVGGKLIVSGEAMVFRRGATFTVNGDAAQGAAEADRTLQLDANYFNFLSGDLVANNTLIEVGAFWVANTGSYATEADVAITLNNTIVNSSGNLKLVSDYIATMQLTNGSVLNVTDFDGYGASVIKGADTVLKIESGSVATLKNLNNEATISLNNGSLNVTGTLNNTGKINLAGANFSAGMITGSRLGADDKAYFNINASDAVTTLNIRDGFEQVIDVNRNGAAGDKVTLTGNVKTSSTANSVIRTFNDVELSNFKVDAVDKAGVGKLFTDGNIAITNNSDINVNWFQVKGNGVIEAGSIVTAPNVNIYDHKTIADTTFTVNGTLKADSLIVTNALYSEYYPEVNGPDGYNTNSVSNFVVGKDGVVESIGTNGRISLQIGHMTVYGYVNANTSTGGGTSWIGSDSEANEYNFCEMTLTVDGTYASEDSNNGKFINRGNQTLQINKVSDLNVINGATFSWAGAINNGGTITVDANSTFYAGSINNYANGKTGSSSGSFNSTVRGEMIVLGDMTVAGCISTEKLVLNAGATLSVGSLSVDDLELNFGSDLAVNGTGSNVGKITIVGELIPQNAEYVLVSSGWANLGETSVWYNNAEYTVVDSAENLAGINFVTIGGNLYVKDFGAATTGIYIGSEVDGLADGAKVTTADGVTYTVGVDAFASIADAKTVLGNKVSDISSIVVDKGETVVDANEAVFGDDLVINNAGHLDANIVAGDTMNITNSSVNTLLGSYTAEYEINVDNAGGMIGDANGDATTFNTSYMSVNGGDATNVEVNAGILELTDTNSFGVNADSGIIKGDDWGLGGSILLNGSANASIDGDIASSDVVVRADIAHTGTLTLNGNQTFTNTIGAANIVIADGKVVTLEDVTFRDMTISAGAKLNVNPDSQNSFTQAGAFHGTGTLNTTQTGAWIVNDSVYRDLKDFAGTVTMENNGASIVMGKGDALSTLTAADSYFANGVNMVVKDSQSVVLAGDGITTGINFSDNGTLNVGNYDGGFVDGSNDFTQTLTGDSTAFTGTVNVSEGAQLTVENALGATAINMDYNSNVNATGADDDTQLNLNKDGLALNAKITGDSNDVINVKENASLEADEALNGFAGTVNVSDEKTIQLNGENTTAAIFNGSASAVIDANAAQTLTADGALNGFSGTIALEDNKLTLNGANSTDAKFTGTNVIDANADQTLNATGALDGFSGTVELEANKLTLNGANSTDAKFTGTNVIDADADQTLNATGALDGFEGTVELEGNKLTLNGANETSAKFTGSNVIDANKDQTLTAAGALDGFSGTVELEGNKLTLNGANTTSAKFTGTNVIDANADQTLNAEGALDGFSGTVELEANKLTLNGANTTAAVFTGSNVIDANANQTLTADGALNGFNGTVELEGNKLTLDGTNVTAAEFVGDAEAVINVNADNTFTADNIDFVGTVNVAENKALTLKGDFSQDEKGTIVFAKGGDLVLEGDEAGEVITIGAKLDNSAVASGFLNSIVTVKTDAELTAEGAVDNFKGKVDIAEDATLTLSGTNTTSMNVQGNGTLELKDGADVELTLRNDRLISGSPAGNSLLNFGGTFAVNDNTLTIETYSQTGAVITGTSDAQLNINKYTNPENGKAYNGSLTLNKEAALDGFNGSVNLTESELILNSSNNTAATFTGDVNSVIKANGVGSAVADQTFSAVGALDGFHGTVALTDNNLTLNGANTTDATITGTEKIAANADQKFTGDVTGFTGEYVIADGKSVTLSGTFADTENSVVNASGATLNLADKSVAVTVNGGTGLNTLNFGNNSLTLGTGDFTNVNGTGSVVFATGHTDNAFASLVAGNVSLTGGRDITATTFDGDLNITIDTRDNNVADVITGSTYGDTIYVTIADDALLSGNDYNLITAGDYTITSIQLFDNVTNSWLTLNFNDGVKANGFTYTLRETYNHTLVLNQLAGFSNFVVINAAWADKVPYQQVIDGTTDRSVGFDAASDLAKAVEYIRGWNVGQGWDNGSLQMGDAKIELVAGKYSLATGTLMTSANGVTQLTIAARDGETATLTGVLRGSDGSTATTLTIEDTRIQATELYGGGKLVINNGADDKSSGNVIAAGIGNTTANSEITMANDSALVINGGYFNNRILVGGSVANAEGAKVTVKGDTSLVIDNNSGETLTIAGNIYGGSWAAKGEVVQTGDASILINADEALNIRGNIYVSGGASANGTLTMKGDSTITFTGNADNLTFTGSVNASQTDNDEIVVFNDFNGKFNGSLIGFDSITISGSSSLEFGRRQTGTADTELNFVVDGNTGAEAMYTVRDANNWEFSKEIIITVDAFTVSNNFILVDNFAKGFEDFTFTINGTSYDWTEAQNNGLTYVGNQLVYNYVSDAQVITNTVSSVVGDTVKVTAGANVTDLTGAGDKNINIVVEDGASVYNVIGCSGIDTTKGGTQAAVDVNLTLGEQATAMYGANNGAIVDDVTITLDSNFAGIANFVIAGHQNAVIQGNSSIVVEDGASYTNGNGDRLVGGIYSASATSYVNGDASVVIGAATLTGGGNIIAGGGQINGNSFVDVNDGAVLNVKSIIGGTSWSGNVENDSAVTITGADVTVTAGSDEPEKRAIYGGSYSGATKGDTLVSITDSTITGNIIAGNRQAASTSTTVEINNSVVNNLSGATNSIKAVGLTDAASTGDATVIINGDNSVVNTTIDGQNNLSASSTLQVNGGKVTGNVAGFDSIELDVDAVLSGSITVGTGGTALNITGISSLTTDIAGAKAVIGSVDSALANVKIDDVDAVLGVATQVAGAATTDDASDDVWASLNQNTDGSLVVAWGRNTAEVGAALEAFRADSTLSLGEALVADAASLAGGADVDDFDNKKNNGTLA